MGVLASLIYIHLKNPIFTFNLLPISILTTPNENWGRKVGVIKNLCVYDNGKVKINCKKPFLQYLLSLLLFSSTRIIINRTSYKYTSG